MEASNHVSRRWDSRPLALAVRALALTLATFLGVIARVVITATVEATLSLAAAVASVAAALALATTLGAVAREVVSAAVETHQHRKCPGWCYGTVAEVFLRTGPWPSEIIIMFRGRKTGESGTLRTDAENVEANTLEPK